MYTEMGKKDMAEEDTVPPPYCEFDLKCREKLLEGSKQGSA